MSFEILIGSSVLIIIGILLIANPSINIQFVKGLNAAKGLKSTITKDTYQFGGMMGYIMIGFGILMLFIGFNS